MAPIAAFVELKIHEQDHASSSQQAHQEHQRQRPQHSLRFGVHAHRRQVAVLVVHNVRFPLRQVTRILKPSLGSQQEHEPQQEPC